MNPGALDSDRSEPRRVSKERIDYLWGRVKQVVFTLGRLTSMAHGIQLYGASQNTYVQRLSKSLVVHIPVKYSARWVILPSSRLRRIWLFIMFLLMVYTATITPYRICFIDDMPTNWLALETAIDCVFMIDVLLNFFTAYLDSELNLVTSNRTIATHYLTTWFFVDFIASIPFQLFEPTSQNGRYNTLVRLMRLPRLYKLIRIAHLVKTLKVKTATEQRLLKSLRMNRALLHLLKFIVGYMILTHILACLWYYTSKIDEALTTTWPVRYRLLDKGDAELYITSFYWVLTTLATVGYGDIVAVTTLERTFTIVVMVCCVAFFSYSISNFSSIVSNSDLRTANLRARIAALDDFSQAVSLPDQLKKKARRSIM